MASKLHGALAAETAKILVVDDHPMTRYGIARLIEQEPGLVVCGEADTPQHAMAAVKSFKPHLVLVDLTMPGGEGLELIKDLRALYPDVAVLVVSMHDERLYAERALRAGARGYIMKNEGGEKLVEAIRNVLRGKTYVSESISASALDILAGRGRSEDSVAGKLTDREFEVFRLLGQGMTTGEIGRRLRLGVKTVETHRRHVREKLGLETSPALIKFAVRWTASHETI